MSKLTDRLEWDKRYTCGHVPVTMDDTIKEIKRLEQENTKLTWRPIKTAPQDGSMFIGCTEKGTIQIIKRNKHLNIWVTVDGNESYRTMTHWMPLPEPPC